MECQPDEHRVLLIVYHLVWPPKRRRPVLVNAVATECRSPITRKCREQRWETLELAIQPDHIYSANAIATPTRARIGLAIAG